MKNVDHNLLLVHFNFSHASLAVDGVDTPLQHDDPYGCILTDPISYPWFVVDLGNKEEVVGVAIANRDIAGEYL